VGRFVERELLLRQRHVGSDHGVQVGQQGGRTSRAVGLVPGAERGVLDILDRGHVLARKAVHQTLRLFQDVVQALRHAGVAHVVAGVAHRGSRNDGQVGRDAGSLAWKIGVAREADFGRQLVAAGAARIPGQQDRVAVLQAFRGDDEEILRFVRHVVRRRIGRAAVLADVRAQEREIAGLARPLVVVDIATEIADHVGRRVHQAHVADHQLPDAVVLEAAVEGGHRAAVRLVGLAFGDQCLDTAFDLLVALLAGQGGGQPLQHAVGDVLDFFGHVHQRARAARQFGRPVFRQEAVDDVIVFRGRIALDRRIAAVVVGDDQAVGRHERRRAPAQRHHRAHRVLRQVRQFFSRHGDADALQFGFELRQLVWLPLPLVGTGGAHGAQEDGRQYKIFEQDGPRVK